MKSFKGPGFTLKVEDVVTFKDGTCARVTGLIPQCDGAVEISFDRDVRGASGDRDPHQSHWHYSTSDRLGYKDHTGAILFWSGSTGANHIVSIQGASPSWETAPSTNSVGTVKVPTNKRLLLT